VIHGFLSTHVGRVIISFGLTYLSGLLPLEKIRETDRVVAFYHPKPGYKIHILLVPKYPVSTLMDLDENDIDFLQDLYSCIKDLVEDFKLETSGYRVIVNGGKYQEFPYLHFHLIAD